MDVSKAIDKAAGAERPDAIKGGHMSFSANGGDRSNDNELGVSVPHAIGKGSHTRGAPATDAAAQWDGWGTALKPAWEPIIMARKPVDGTVAANVLRWGTGGINVDACRISLNGESAPTGSGDRRNGTKYAQDEWTRNHMANGGNLTPEQGRWPANVLHDSSDEVLRLFPSGTGAAGAKDDSGRHHGIFDGRPGKRSDTWGAPRDERGSAARFFYCGKASRHDRDEGLEGMEERATAVYGNETVEGAAERGRQPRHAGTSRNHHPTVKPTQLMRYLVRLVTPPGGIVLDPFMGSGSTGKAAVLEGFGFLGIELDAEYLEIARRRIQDAQARPRLFEDVAPPQANG